MFDLSGKPGSNRGGEAHSTNPTLKDPYGRTISVKSLVEQANTVPLFEVFKDYAIHVDEYNRKARCPVHSNGTERTPSFWYYPETNSFYCFGCKISGGPTELIAATKEMSRYDAALFVIENYGKFLRMAAEVPETHASSNDKILLVFSEIIYDFIADHERSDESIAYAEKICAAFDQLVEKRSPNHDAMVSAVEKLQQRLELYR
jgi:DNA primase